MTKDEAVAALVDMPQVKAIEVATLNPGDVIVIECPGHISGDTADRLVASAEAVFHGHKAIILAEGLHMRIARHET